MLSNALFESHLQVPGQTGFYKGKVRDVYYLGDQLLMVATDRISAFDHVLPKAIPFKGQVLNQLATYFLEATRDIVPNWWLASPDPNVTIGYKAVPFRVEMVIRGYLAGHAWREYQAGKRELCGVKLPEGLKESDRLPEPIITPATKADEGHDEDISKGQILAQGIVSPEDYQILEEYTRSLFSKGTEMAAAQGLILVDTKYEFGKYNDQILLIDEVHTPDSSRYFIADGYEERQESGERQRQLSKEFVREWLMANGFQGKSGQRMPDMPQEFVDMISARYIELYERVTGLTFVPDENHDIHSRIQKNLDRYFQD